MSTDTFFKGLCALIFSGVIAWAVWDKREQGTEVEAARQRYLPCISGQLLPVCMLTLAVCALMFCVI